MTRCADVLVGLKTTMALTGIKSMPAKGEKSNMNQKWKGPNQKWNTYWGHIRYGIGTDKTQNGDKSDME